MAHNIGQMFYFGEIPWHRLGTALTTPATMEEALAAGGLDWTVSMMPLALVDEHDSDVPQRVAVVRDDIGAGKDGRVLGVVHPNFKLLQNREGAELFDSLFGKGKPVYYTGGFLKKGEMVWLMAKLPDTIKLAGEEKLDAYLLFSNSHDGSLPIDIRLTTVRVVCNNTLSLALRKKDQAHVFRRGHNGSFEVLKAEAEAFMVSVVAQLGETTDSMTKLIAAQCTDDAFAAFLKKLLPVPARPATASTNSKAAKAHDTRMATIAAKRDQIMALHKEGHTVDCVPPIIIPAAEKTWWGALNSVTAWVDHVGEIEGDRFANAMFGTGDQLKTAAYHRIWADLGGKSQPLQESVPSSTQTLQPSQQQRPVAPLVSPMLTPSEIERLRQPEPQNPQLLLRL